MRDVSTPQVALDLADQNIKVFPACPADKAPAIEDWNKGAASTDAAQIRKWFNGTGFLLAVPTGELNGFDALDADPRKNGHLWLAENRHLLPATREHTTRSDNGLHLLFNHRPGMRNSTSKIAPGVDVRGDGGFIIWWPGHGYPFHDHSLLRLPEWPDWLAELAMARRYGVRGSDGTVSLDRRIPPSAQAVVELLTRLPNPADFPREGDPGYVSVMFGAAGCIHALREGDAPLDPEEEAAIGDAAIAWAERWEGTPRREIDERAKWYDDWLRNADKKAGWQSLQAAAAKLIPGYREEQAAEQFAEPCPDVDAPLPADGPGNPYGLFYHFWAYLPQHNYIYAPTRDLWPAPSVNSQLPSVPLTDKEGKPVLDKQGNPIKLAPAAWLDRFKPVQQMTWAPGLPQIIRHRYLLDGGWVPHYGARVFNLYLPPKILPGDATRAGKWIDHVKYVYPDDAEHIFDWLAHRVQHPEDKLNHALVLGGPMGIGKDSLLEPVKYAVGP